jgi:molybdenum cofactor cytidylyltransferase
MLAPVGEDGSPLLQKVCETWLRAGLDELLVVLGCDAADIRTTLEGNLRTPLRFVENPKWEAGMFSSVKAGVAAASGRSTRFAISPADLPFLSRGTLRTVIDAAASVDERTVVVPTFHRRRGHPLVIPSSLRARILSWPDSARLNQIFEEPDVTLRHLEGFDETILRDVDTPGDLSR